MTGERIRVDAGIERRELWFLQVVVVRGRAVAVGGRVGRAAVVEGREEWIVGSRGWKGDRRHGSRVVDGARRRRRGRRMRARGGARRRRGGIIGHGWDLS